MVIGISTIVPMYKGIKYLEKIVSNIENAQQAAPGCCIELLLVNDYPYETLNSVKSDIISVKVINSHINRGIHGARVYGLSFANGEYIHFLDQDDEISKEFYSCLLETIGDADVAYCRAYSDRTEIYNSDSVFEESNKRENFFVRVPMMSPGQALIKREAIPTIWTDKILKHNGCDDYMLWLCMLSQNKKFALNEKKLYRHCNTLENLSNDMYTSFLSDCEVAEILLQTNLFEGKEKELVANIPYNQFKRKNLVQMKARATLSLIDIFERLEEKQVGLINYLKENNIKKYIIYGYGDFGKHIKRRLSSSDLECVFIIDKNFEYFNTDVQAGNLDQCNIDADAVLVTIVTECENVISNLKERNFKNVINTKELLIQLDLKNYPFIWG